MSGRALLLGRVLLDWIFGLKFGIDGRGDELICVEFLLEEIKVDEITGHIWSKQR